ncbi:carbonic anhydrase 2-like [Rhagoletis pomonella]|uniref:carbonic anhydrase 2-like n=1 Tax=Rhagoletis pomonella TaxID=28610 RepID=UPI00177E6AB9|nr:carbonic anhydrase 2-like [Rhagoletis pomonella]
MTNCSQYVLPVEMRSGYPGAAHGTSDFDYEHQSKWYDNYQQCSFNRQSPIELNSNEAIVSYDMPLVNFVHYDVPYRTAVRSENNGHTANIQLPTTRRDAAYITGGPLVENTTYIMESLHFHWGSNDSHGSEHVLNSQRYAMEMHLLHRNTKYASVEEAREHEDGLAVLAVLYESTASTDFEGLNEVVDVLESISEFNRSTEIKNFTLSVLLGDMDTAEFYTYAGSLTTPPCSQAVTWVIFSQPINITHSQLMRFHKMSDGHGDTLENNYRALQAKGNRKVYLRNKRKVLESSVQSSLYWELLNKLKAQGGAAVGARR